jgi:hypothetical protein
MEAIQCVQRTQSTQGQGSLWDDFTMAHLNTATGTHGFPAFLPWHRGFLIIMEKILQDCSRNSTLTIP